MTFSKKIFLSVFFTTLALGSVLIWTSHKYITQQTEEKYISRYSVLTKVLADTLTSLDQNTEALMSNAAKVIAAEDAAKGVLSNTALKKLRDELSVSHVFVINKKGKFIRSTNEDAALIPNLFSFCENYKNLVLGTSLVEATPIIKPDPEPKPHKFLSIPSHDKKRIIEVGTRVDFIGKTLAEAMSSDKNVIAMSLFDPNGIPFGRFHSNNVDFKTEKVTLPEDFKEVQQTDDNFKFFSKVEASHRKCCQCDVSGTSKDGEYYYVLEAQVSKDELKAIQATTNQNFLILGFINLIFSLILSRVLSRRLVWNIEKAANKVKRISEHGNVKERISQKGNDEVAFLTEEFDRMLDRLEESQDKIIESEKTEAKVQLAKEIAHNIRSPIIAIEMMLPMMVKLPERMKSVLYNSVKEIKALSERLKTQADALANSDLEKLSETETLYLPIILQDIVNQKQLEYSSRSEIRFEFKDESGCSDAFTKGCSIDFKSILSNLINNAVESYGSHGGLVEIKLTCDLNSCSIFVCDSGVGIPSEFLVDMGTKQMTFKGNKGRGLGLTHAYKVVRYWGGEVSIQSKIGVGTSIRVDLMKINATHTLLKHRLTDYI